MILEEIAQKTRERVEENKKQISPQQIQKEAFAKDNTQKFPFEEALRRPGIQFICEVKKASPSKGIIAEKFPYLEIAREYEAAGAAAISVLTEPFYFLGSDTYLRQIAQEVHIPILRKDFTVDEYMIYEAKVLGADAILLICSILEEEQIRDYQAIAHSLGLSVLTEAHDEEEVEMAIRCQSRIIGVNNRNLKDFSVNINNSTELRKKISKDIIFVSESGMKTREDILALEKNGTDAVLIGEALMKQKDKKRALNELRGLR